MKKSIAIALSLILIIAVTGCTDAKSRSKGVYMLLDTSGTYALELTKAPIDIKLPAGRSSTRRHPGSGKDRYRQLRRKRYRC